MKKEENRRAIVFVPESEMLDLFFARQKTRVWATVIECSSLPDTAKVMGVHYDYGRASFAFVVEDESFENVSRAVQLPELRVEWIRRKVALQPA